MPTDVLQAVYRIQQTSDGATLLNWLAEELNHHDTTWRQTTDQNEICRMQGAALTLSGLKDAVQQSGDTLQKIGTKRRI